MTEYVEGTTDDLDSWQGEDLVLMGCGGEPKEWVQGLTTHLCTIGLMSKDVTIIRALSFTVKDMKCIAVTFSNNKIHGHLAIWRLCARRGRNDLKLAFIRKHKLDVEDPVEPLHPYESMWTSDFIVKYC